MTSRGGQHCFNGGRCGSGVPSRDCHVGLRPPRNDKSGGQHRFNGGRYGSGGAFPRLPRRFAPRNDKSGGQHCFNGGQYGSGVPSRDCHVASLLAMTNRRCVPFYDGSFRTAVPSRDCHVGLRPPRNDKSGGQHRFNGGRYGSGGAFPRLPRRFAPRNDKSGGQHCFNGGQYGSGVPSRDCHVASLLAMTNRRCVPFYDGSFRTAVPSRDCHVGLRPPRNDKSGSRYDQLNLPLILRFPPYWRSPRRR